MKRLEKIKERCEAASSAPWHMAMPACDHPDCEALDDTSSVECSETGLCVVDCTDDKDASFISRARSDLPWAVSWIERAAPWMRQELEAWARKWNGLLDVEKELCPEIMETIKFLVPLLKELEQLHETCWK